MAAVEGVTRPPVELSDTFRAILRDEREELNRRFAAHSHLSGGLDGEAFLFHLAETVDPIVIAVAEVLPECARTVAIELYDLSLQLFASHALGPQATSGEIHRVWVDVLPRIPRLISRDAAAVAGALSNAAFNVARADGGRLDFWLHEILVAALACDNAARLFECGKVLAWRAGMVQYRTAAIDAAAALPQSLAVSTLGLPSNTDPAALRQVLEHLRRSPWHRLEPASDSSLESNPPPQAVRTVGDFRGFGGQFLRPPRVGAHRDVLFATDGHSTWRLLVDCYGSLLHRIGGGELFPKTRSSPKTATDARIVIARRHYPELAEAASVATTPDTVAVAFRDSHRVIVIAMASGDE